MEANDRLSLLATESIRNAQGGIIKGKDVSLVATNGNIINERTRVSEDTRYAGGVQHNDYVNSAARIEAGNNLELTAGKDIRNSGSVLQAGGNATLKAGRDLEMVSTEQLNSSEGRHKKTSWSQSQTTQYGSQVSVGGSLTATAGDSEDTSSEVESLELYLPEGKTYNLTVDVGHTFYVGELKTWVHNTGPCDLPPDYFTGGTKATGSGAKFADQAKLDDHYARHGNDFGAKNALEYQAQADKFLTAAKPAGVLEKARANGDIVRYNPNTDEFGVVSSGGSIRTYYKPDPAVHGKASNLDYFNAQ
ncbi:hypothetical protein D3C73_675120 [compost metagenome]